jgi:hypothetical protein
MNLTALREFPARSGIIACPDRHWIWLKVCRCAGTSIFRRAMRDQNVPTLCRKSGDQPREWRAWFDSLTQDELDNYTVWTVIRHPVDRFLSCLAHFHIGVEQFCDNPTEHLRPAVREHMLSQSLYTAHADRVFRFERLNEQWPDLCELTGMDPAQRLVHCNTSRRAGGSSLAQIPSRLHAFVHQWCIQDMETLGYQRSEC